MTTTTTSEGVEVEPAHEPPTGSTSCVPDPSCSLHDRLVNIEAALLRVESTLALVVRVLDAAGRAWKPLRRVLDDAARQ